VFTAVDADEANELAAMWEAKGDIISHGTSTFSRLAVGTNDYVLQADSSAASGLAWGQVATAGIADSAVTAAKIADDAVAAAKIADDAVVTAGILDANVTEAKLATAVVNKLVPAGTISATIRSTADTGYLLLDGSTVASAQTTYPALWAVVPVSWQSGSSLVLPDMSDKMLFGQSTTSLGASGGANSKTIASANLPTHVHTLSSHTHTMNDHVHSLSSHTHTVDPDSATTGGPNDDIVRRLNSYSGGYVIPYDANNDGLADGVTYAGGTTPGMAISGTDFSHTHTIDLPSKTSSGPSVANTGSNNDATDGPSTNTTGDGGFTNTALDVTNAHLAVNFQIKAH
jgi:microcystin-dependent protein